MRRAAAAAAAAALLCALAAGAGAVGTPEMLPDAPPTYAMAYGGFPPPRIGGVAGVIGEHLYTFGGTDSLNAPLAAEHAVWRKTVHTELCEGWRRVPVSAENSPPPATWPARAVLPAHALACRFGGLTAYRGRVVDSDEPAWTDGNNLFVDDGLMHCLNVSAEPAVWLSEALPAALAGGLARAASFVDQETGWWYVVGGLQPTGPVNASAAAGDDGEHSAVVGDAWRYRPGDGWQQLHADEEMLRRSDAAVLVEGDLALVWGGRGVTPLGKEGSLAGFNATAAAEAFEGRRDAPPAPVLVAPSLLNRTDDTNLALEARLGANTLVVPGEGRGIVMFGSELIEVARPGGFAINLTDVRERWAELEASPPTDGLVVLHETWNDGHAKSAFFTPGHRPWTRSYAMLAPDAARGRAYVLSGGAIQSPIEIGWFMNNDMFTYSLGTRRWIDTSARCLPFGRRNQAWGRESETAVAMYGGKHQNGGIFNDVWLYSVPLDRWTRVYHLNESYNYAEHTEAIPVPNDEACLAVRVRHNTSGTTRSMYVFGGDGRGREGDQRLFSLSLVTDDDGVVQPAESWNRTFEANPDDAPQPRYGTACAMGRVADGDVFVVAFGTNSNEGRNDKVWLYHFSNQSWVETTHPHTPRSDSFGGVYDGQLWVYGGYGGSTVGQLNDVLSVDLSTFEFTEHTDFAFEQGELPKNEDYATALVGNRWIIATTDGNVLVLHLDDRTVTRLTPVGERPLKDYSRDRASLGCDDQDCVLMFGYSQNQQGYLADLQRFHHAHFCRGLRRLSVSDTDNSTKVASVTDLSFSSKYMPGSVCQTAVEDENGENVTLVFTAVDLGEGDHVLVYDGNSTSGKLLAWMNSSTTLKEGDELVIEASGPHIFVHFEADDNSSTTGQGFTAVSARRCVASEYGDHVSSACVECPVGSVTTEPGRAVCSECGKGTYQPAGGQSACLDCAAGGVATSTSSCQPCDVGRFSNLTQNVDCRRCERSEYQPGQNMTECIACPPNSASLFAGASALDHCLCVEGFYQHLGTGACLPCPGGAVCRVSARPEALPGFFTAEQGDGTVLVFECPAGACTGSNRCAAGHDGFKCASCTAGYAKNEARCLACPETPTPSILLALAVVCAFCGASALVWYYTNPTRARSRFSLGSPAILIDYLQIMYLFSLLDIDWPNYTESLMEAGGLATFSLAVFRPGCVFDWDFYSRWKVRAFLPPAFLALSGVLLVLRYCFVWWRAGGHPPTRADAALVKEAGDAAGDAKKAASRLEKLRGDPAASEVELLAAELRARAMAEAAEEAAAALPAPPAGVGLWAYLRRSFHEDRRHIGGACVFTMHLLYVFASSNALQLFSCTKQADGSYHLNSAPDTLCMTSEWYRTLPLGVIFGLGYALGIPAMFCFLAWRFREPNTRVPGSGSGFDAYMGRLAFPFKDRYFAWVIVQTGRKFVIVVTLVFSLDWLGASAVTLLTSVAGLLVVEATLKPYRLRQNNFAEVLVSGTVFLTLLLGLLFFSTLTVPENRDSAVAAHVFGALITIALVVCVGVIPLEYFRLRRQPQLQDSVTVKRAQKIDDSDDDGETTVSGGGMDDDDDDDDSLAKGRGRGGVGGGGKAGGGKRHISTSSGEVGDDDDDSSADDDDSGADEEDRRRHRRDDSFGADSLATDVSRAASSLNEDDVDDLLRGRGRRASGGAQYAAVSLGGGGGNGDEDDDDDDDEYDNYGADGADAAAAGLAEVVVAVGHGSDDDGKGLGDMDDMAASGHGDGDGGSPQPHLARGRSASSVDEDPDSRGGVTPLRNLSGRGDFTSSRADMSGGAKAKSKAADERRERAAKLRYEIERLERALDHRGRLTRVAQGSAVDLSVTHSHSNSGAASDMSVGGTGGSRNHADDESRAPQLDPLGIED